MKLLKAPLIAAMVGVSAIGIGAATLPSPTQAASGDVPIEVWSLRDVVNAVQVSPDGKHVLVHVNPSREGEYLLQIYKTSNLSEPYRTLKGDRMELIAAQWVSDNWIFGTAWQVKDKSVKRPEDDIRGYEAFTYDLSGNEFVRTDGNFGLVSLLPKEPDHILVRPGGALNQSTGVDPFSLGGRFAYYRFDLKDGARELVMRGNTKFPSAEFDIDGNPRYTQSFDFPSKTVQQYYRLPGDGTWKPFGPELDQNDPDNLYRFLSGLHQVVGFDPDDPKIGYVIDNPNGEDKTSLWKLDFTTGEYVERMFQAEDADVMGVMRSSMPDENRIVAALYPGAKMQRHWFDEEEKALYEALETNIPYAHDVSITSRSRDGNTMIVYNRGPRDPGSYYILIDGQIAKLGSRNPLVKGEQLADVKYFRYQARDGLEIPGYITMPEGEGPFPLIVQHNGGPHVNGMVGYDEWGQMLADAGYMVFHPENRIAVGWGQKHFDAGYGEHGLAMQDDKDDGVKYLIEQGLVDPDRVAFFGWSYGGYAALVAASREDNLYQCTIAGAAVANPEKTYKMRRSPYSAEALDEWSKRRGTIGINPMNEIENVNIPLLMVHPKQDRRVMYFNFQDYKKEFEKAGKDGQFLTLDGADHFYNTLMYNHQQQLYTKMLDYLANDCGPGGL